MSNMSYCRWHNTRLDMLDCFDSFENFDDECDYISEEEVRYAKSMIREMCDFLYEREVIQDYDYTRLFKRFDEMCEKE